MIFYPDKTEVFFFYDTQLSSKFKKTLTDLSEEREMNKCLRDNQKLWQDKVDTMDRKLNERDKVRMI